MINNKIQLSITANSAKALLMLATQQIDLLTTDNIRLKYRVQELTDQCNEINNKLHEKEQHFNIGPSYEEMENALLTEQEHNGNLTKEVDRLNAILRERDAEIERQKRLYDDLNDVLQQTKAKLPKKKKEESPSAPTLEEVQLYTVMSERDFDGLLRMFEARQSLYAEDKQNLENARHHAQKAYEDALKKKKQMQARIDKLESELALMKQKYEPEKK